MSATRISTRTGGKHHPNNRALYSVLTLGSGVSKLIQNGSTQEIVQSPTGSLHNGSHDVEEDGDKQDAQSTEIV